MKIGVTGGSGFIGSHVVDKLRDTANHEVRVIDVKAPYRQDVDFVKTDLTDYGQVKNALKGLDVVYHLAAAADVNDYKKDPLVTSRNTIISTLNTTEAARENNLERIILASTVWMYSGALDRNVDEEASLSAGTSGHIYTAAKLHSEQHLKGYKDVFGAPNFTILRYGIPYGPRSREAAVIPTFVKRALGVDKSPITLDGDGSQARYFLYVEDLAKGNVAALKDTAINEAYNLDGQEKVTIKQLAHMIKRITNSNVEITTSAPRPGDYRQKFVSIEKAKRDLDWAPTTRFEDGLKRYIEWYMEQPR